MNALTQFRAELALSLTEGSFVRLVLSSPVAPKPVIERVLGRYIRLKDKPHLSFTLRHAHRDEVRNLGLGEAIDWVMHCLGSEFQSALLGTTTGDWQLSIPINQEPRLIRHKASQEQAPPAEHDQPRHTMLDSTAQDWLIGLQVLARDGRVRPALSDKHRQIHRYLEILSHLARDCGWVHDETDRTQAEALAIYDMGCGKGYLTFGAWHWFSRRLKHPVNVVGVERRADLVADSNRLARQIGAKGLEFVCGDIAETPVGRADILVALHACDTATDDAIRRGLESSARLIVVAPCCHREVRGCLGHPEPLTPVLRHGLMQEELAEWLTDGLRALFLEWAGYRTKIFEFVSPEHTPKNRMIAAIRERAPFADLGARDRILELKSFFGIKSFALDPLLGDGAKAAITSTSL
jgi:SAM-dependent methyltransferase